MSIDQERIQILAERTRKGCLDSENQLAAALLPVADQVARSFVIPGNDREENRSIAVAALAEAIKSVDPERGPAVAFVRRVVSNALVKEKAKRLASKSTADSDFVEGQAEHNPAAEKVDPAAVRRAWPFLTHAEKRGVWAVVSETMYCEVGDREGVTKQAVEKGWRSARALIDQVRSGSPVRRRPQPESHFDYRIDELLARLG